MDQRRALYEGAYGAKFPGSVPYVAADGRLYGIWILGNNYRSKSGYHGSYPPNYLDRVTSMFTDAERVLHLFSGSLPPDPNYTRVDMREDIDTDVRGNAEDLSTLFPAGTTFDCIYADPPYTEEDATKYGVPMVNRNKVVREVYKVLEPGGFLVWMDMVLPMYRKDELEIAGVIGLVRSTNHRFRNVVLFRKLP
jgi:hypothetical protein